MSGRKTAAAVLAVLGLGGLGAVHTPSGAAPSLSGVVIKCPAFCVNSGPVTGSNLLPDATQKVHWFGTWTQVSTSATTPSAPVESLEILTTGSVSGGDYTGSGTMWLYYYDYYGGTFQDNEYKSTHVSITITSGAVHVRSASLGIDLVGTNVAGSFSGVGTRAKTG
jgi:hypothetical protein